MEQNDDRKLKKHRKVNWQRANSNSKAKAGKFEKPKANVNLNQSESVNLKPETEILNCVVKCDN